MIEDIRVHDWRGRQFILKIQGIPDECPICHRGIEPADQKWDFFVTDPGRPCIERVFRCPKKDCQRLFIARYGPASANSGLYTLTDCVPRTLRGREFTQQIRDVSPDFCDICNQAHMAEQQELLLVCGPGYRKALEFLIKDYVSLSHSAEEARKEIQGMPLGACIQKYVSDTRIRTTAERAVWLGNDETHYVRKWADKDLQDLKNLIQLACYWIESEELTKAAAVEMPAAKK